MEPSRVVERSVLVLVHLDSGRLLAARLCQQRSLSFT
jgi:hypothetical protein